jgi:hypothetical protein
VEEDDGTGAGGGADEREPALQSTGGWYIGERGENERGDGRGAKKVIVSRQIERVPEAGIMQRV